MIPFYNGSDAIQDSLCRGLWGGEVRVYLEVGLLGWFELLPDDVDRPLGYRATPLLVPPEAGLQGAVDVDLQDRLAPDGLPQLLPPPPPVEGAIDNEIPPFTLPPPHLPHQPSVDLPPKLVRGDDL